MGTEAITAASEALQGRIFGTGEMAERTRALDWSRTPVGPIEQWPAALLTAVNMLLASRYPMFLWWGEELVQFYNDAYCPSLGAEKHPKALGQKGIECWPEIWPMVGSEIEAVMSRGEASWHEDQLVPIYRNGKLEDVYWTYSYSPVRDSGGNICGTLVTTSETTGRVLAERQLRQVLEATTDAVLSLTRDWAITYLNGHARKILEPTGDILGKNFWETFPGTVYEGSPYVENYRRAMDEGVAGEFEAYYPEPLNNWFKISARPAQDGVILFFRDITEHRRAAAALLQSEKLAVVGRLAASIAHEINNPLESVTNLLYLARSSSELSKVQKYLDTAERELRRVSVISSQTLRFHKQSTSPTSVTCETLMEGILPIYQGRIINARVQVEERKRTSKAVLCFEGEIRQVLSNLIGNAIDAMRPEGGRLLLRSREATNWKTGNKGLMLTIADTGIGMSPHTLHKMFDAFFTTKGAAGTGLGLWVSQEIVHRHQGALKARSTQRESGSGTVFALFLPFDAAIRSI